MSKSWALGFAAALCAAPALAQEGGATFERPYWLDRSVIEANGRAQIEALPDRASFSVTFQEVARESGDASGAAADRARLATAAMRQRSGDAVEIRSNVSIQPIYEQYRDREGVRQDSQRADQIANYVARVILNVEIRDISRAADVRAAALAAAPQGSTDITFYLRQTAEMQRRAFTAAVEDAAARARAAAQAAGARLGPLLALQEGAGPCLGEWRRPVVGYDRSAAMHAPTAAFEAAAPVVEVTGSRGQTIRLTSDEIARLQLAADPSPVTLSAQVCAVYAAGP
jgi:uncharacterized protein YggE